MNFIPMILCVAALSGACRPELPDNLFVCAVDDECPEQFVCVEQAGIGRCVRGARHEDPLQQADSGPNEGADTDMTARSRPDSGVPALSKPRSDAGAAQPADTMSGAKNDAGMKSVEVAPAPDCVEDSDCNAAGPCALARCQGGRCELEPIAQGTPLSAAEQVQGDCQALVCDGAGEVATQPQADDLPPDDGNACQKPACMDGQPARSPLPDGETCNGTGQCQGGACSVCQGGSDCTKPSDCTVHKTECVQGKPQCMDTGMALDGKTCSVGSVCSAKQCVSCVLGAACGDSEPCQRSRITSCATGPHCTSEPLTGTSCGRDRVCAAGSCVYACPTSPCGDAAACESGRWDCSDPTRPPACLTSALADGAACNDDSTCHAGSCSRAALVNGDFSQGFRGWSLTGDAAKFLIGVDAKLNRRFVTTWVNADDGNGDRAKGSVAQTFTVPADALALRFWVSGGHAYIRLRDEAGSVLQEVTGIDSNERHVPVSWDLVAHRGRRLTISIDDELDTSGWSFVAALGFDVIRDVDAPLRNSQFRAGLEHWDLRGDGQYFDVWEDANYLRTVAENMLEAAPAYGTRHSVTSYVHSTSAPRQTDAAVGSVSQRFVVPPDAVAMRFNIHGGRLGRVELREGNTRLYLAAGADDNTIKQPINWDLTPHRGKTLEVAIVDDQGSGGWTFISSTGFDVITSYNGP